MSIRTKTKKRLLILLAACVLLVGAAAALYVVRQQQIAERMAGYRAEGIEAVKAEDYEKALELLGKYWKREKQDAEAVYNLAIARLNVEAIDNKHIGNAMALFERALALDPNHEQAMRELLDIRVMAQMNVETVELADRLLKIAPDDVEVMHKKAIGLIRLRKFDDALKVCQKATGIAPDDLQAQITTMMVMSRLDQDAEEILSYARSVYDKDPDNPRLQVLMGYAHALTNNRPTAAEWIQKAAKADPPDAEFVRIIAEQLNGIGRFGDSMKYLDQHATKFDEPQLTRMYARRLWENSRTEDLVNLLKDHEAEDDDVSSDILVLKTMGLMRQGQQEQADKIIAALAGRSGDNTAHAWVPLLRDLFGQKRDDIKEALDTLRESVDVLPGDPYLRMFLAEAYHQLGENELALEQWETVTELAPAWAQPYVSMANVYTDTNRPRQALNAAQNGLVRAPNNVAAVVTVAKAWSKMIESGEADDSVEQYATLLEEVQKAAPGEPNTLPLYIDVLARQGDKDKARQVLTGAITKHQSKLGEKALLRLAGVSQKHNLGVADQIFEHVNQGDGMSPNVAYAQAARLVDQQSKQAGIDYLQPLVEQHGADNLAWQLAWARFLDQIDDSRAVEAWKTIGNKHPENLRIQRMVLDAKAVQDQRDFMDQTIDRVKSLSGDEGLTWQIARAKWLLSGDQGTRNATQAVQILNEIVKKSPDLIEPRLLLAAALNQLDNTTGAIDQLNAASSLKPGNLSIKLELARLRLADGDVSSARSEIEQILADPDLDKRQQAQVASLLAQLGDTQQAMELLESQGEPSLLLAELYIRRSRIQDAQRQYQQLMENPTPQVVQSYANLLGATGRVDEGLNVMAHLKTMDLKPGVVDLLYGEFYRRYISPEQALKHYQAAAESMPESQMPWLTMLDIHVQAGDYEKVIQINEQAKQAIPGNKIFNLIDTQRDLLKTAVEIERLRPLVQAVLHDAANRDAALVVLRTIKQASDESQSMVQAMLSISKLADKHPRFKPLQLLLVDTYATVGRYDDAIALATRAMEAFPNDDDSAKRAARLLGRVSRWDEALAVARQWRERSLNQPVEADMMIAQALLRLDQPQQALNQISRYQNVAMNNPTQLPGVVAMQAEGLIAMNRVDEASNILKPLIPTHPRWRSLWMQLAMSNIEEAQRSAEWLERAEKVIPQQSIQERITLANNWFQLGNRTNNSQYRSQGVEQLKALAYMSDASADAIVAYAILAYQLGDLNQAEKEYRRALKIKPDHPTAQNNLAILIADRHGDLEEALQYAQGVVETNPKMATFHDTLAHVYSARGEYDKAVESLNKALELEPESIEWRVNLAEAHRGKGDLDAARDVVEEIDTLSPDFDRLPPAIQKRLNTLRQSLSNAAVTVP